MLFIDLVHHTGPLNPILGEPPQRPVQPAESHYTTPRHASASAFPPHKGTSSTRGTRAIQHARCHSIKSPTAGYCIG
jgi:hypothetical protein